MGTIHTIMHSMISPSVLSTLDLCAGMEYMLKCWVTSLFVIWRNWEYAKQVKFIGCIRYYICFYQFYYSITPLHIGLISFIFPQSVNCPCENGGTCVLVDGNVECTCTEDFTGMFCQTGR